MTPSFIPFPGAVELLLLSPTTRALLYNRGIAVRDDARQGARAITTKVDAIIAEQGFDAAGPYVDVGYQKHHPGFFLWWWEVGTVKHAAHPHLRPALRDHT